MKQKILAVKDRAIDAFLQPFFTPALGAGIRAFQDEISNEQSPMHKHPDDYDLYHLGEFDTSTGEFSTIQPQQIAVGKQLTRE